VDVDVDVDDASERVVDVGKNFASIRILERRYLPPRTSASDTDVEMATVVITFPRN
jgi:hypothetical protein